VPLADVFPLVSTRALARPFTYEVPEGVGKGAVVAIQWFGGLHGFDGAKKARALAAAKLG
jgi:hypothetical protein